MAAYLPFDREAVTAVILLLVGGLIGYVLRAVLVKEEKDVGRKGGDGRTPG